VDKLNKGDLVRWRQRLSFVIEKPHRGIVREVCGQDRYLVQWFTDDNEVGSHRRDDLIKMEDRGHETKSW
jgi:hypothetical protein